MDEIEALFSINIRDTVMSVFIILFGILAIIRLVESISERLGKPVKWLRDRNQDHELLQKTVAQLLDLSERHRADAEEETNRDDLLQDELTNFAKEMRDCIAKTQIELEQFSENRVHDREQSLEIQKQLTEEIKKVAEGGEVRNQQIQNLTQGMMELLGDKIDQRYSRYISLNGIPENEVDEFSGLYHAYAANGGNSTRKEKFDYVMSHMKVIPVETVLLQDDVDKADE